MYDDLHQAPPRSLDFSREYDSRVGHPIGEAPFVVIPRHDANQATFNGLGLRCIKDRAEAGVIEVNRDQLRVIHSQHALELTVGGLADGVIHIIDTVLIPQ